MGRSGDCSTITPSRFEPHHCFCRLFWRTLCPSSTLRLPELTMFLTLDCLRRLCCFPDIRFTDDPYWQPLQREHKTKIKPEQEMFLTSLLAETDSVGLKREKMG